MSPYGGQRTMSTIRQTNALNTTLKTVSEDFPGGPVVKTSPSNAGGAGLNPG